jgi:ribosomal subunit interface protein
MIIQIDTDNKLSVHEVFRSRIQELLAKELNRFINRLIKVEVYLTDENARKKGVNDKKCVIDAHLEGTHPVVVSQCTGDHEHALHGAIDKLKKSLDTITGKMQNH